MFKTRMFVKLETCLTHSLSYIRIIRFEIAEIFGKPFVCNISPFVELIHSERHTVRTESFYAS